MVTTAPAADQLRRLLSGQETVIELEENPSTGYQWQIDLADSSNLSILHLTDKGFTQARFGDHPVVGAPGVHSWTIKAVAAGKAAIVFVYRRVWERTPIQKYIVTVEVSAP